MRRFLISIVLVLAFFSMSAVSHAQNTAAQEERKARLEREIAIIDKQLAENASKSSTMLADLSLIRKKVSNRKALVAESDKEIRKLNAGKTDFLNTCSVHYYFFFCHFKNFLS